jgi:hypothetical protein
MYDFDRTTKENNSKKYDSDLANVLTSIKNYLIGSPISFLSKTSKIRSGAGGILEKEETTTTNAFGVLDESLFFSKFNTDAQAKSLQEQQSLAFGYGDLLNNIYENCTYKGYHFEKNNNSTIINYINGSDSFAAYGNAWQYVSQISLTTLSGIDNLTPLPIDFFYGYSTQFSKGGKIVENNNTFDIDSVNYQYIKFGHLLALIQHVCIFTESPGGNIIIDTNSSTNDLCSCSLYRLSS